MPSLSEAILWSLLLVVPAALMAAAASDLVRYIIPNTVSILLLAVFPLAALAEGMPLETMAYHGLAGLFMLVIGFVLFVRNFMGGGDVKLLTACAVWTGFPQMPAFVLATAIAGGLVALVMLVVRLARRGRAEGSLRQAHVPYGAAIALGGLAVFPRLSLVAPLIG
ncbi:MAG: hypothetical protein EXQ94_00575 [Alphaproteobacteria bacterium]|nr:hypothetical protein [Alphaproteobacteria bacterium]